MVPRTLRARLVAAAGGSILAAVTSFAVAAVLIVDHQLRGSLDGALRSRAEDVAQLAVSAPAVLSDPGALESPVSGRQIVVEVLDAHGRILARSLTLGARLLPEDRLEIQARATGVAGFETVGIGGRSFRLYAAPIAQAGGQASGGVVLVASDTTDIGSTISHLGWVLALTGLGAAALAVLAAAALTRRGLGPLRRLAGAAAEIERTADPTHRLPEAGVDDEIGKLTGVLNRMLASLESARASERRFLADASHELRTPVTALRGNVEYAARHGADPELLAEIGRDSERLVRLVDDLLVLERAGAVAREPVAVDLGSLVDEVVSERGERVRAENVDALWVRGEPEGLRRVLDNLLENALVHGPPDGAVTVTLARAGARARLTVRDEGPGPPHHERIFERFWRGPGAAARPGSGLGLAIVATIVERHGGRIELQGSAFTVDLPAMSGAPEWANSHTALSER